MPSIDSSAEPNPARDARRRVHAERERRRAARALDRYMEIMLEPVIGWSSTHDGWRVAGERFVEAVGDYVLSELHHNGDYGVPAETTDWAETASDLISGDLERIERHGVPRCPVDGQWCSTCRIGGSNGTGGVCARQERPQVASSVPTNPGFGVHFGDDDRTACGKSSPMIYQCTQDRKTVTCPACKEAYDRDPCAGGLCCDPAAHAEGAHDV